jgi:hypothetical protein
MLFYAGNGDDAVTAGRKQTAYAFVVLGSRWHLAVCVAI